MTDTITINNQTLLHINMTNVTKLSPLNYLMWKLQVHALVDGYDLADYLDGSGKIPSATVTTEGVVSENPDYVNWKRQDKLIYSALLGSISLVVQPILSLTTTSCEIWNTIADTYGKPNRGHVQQIYDQLKAWTKGIVRLTMDHDDQIELILEGLPEEYRPIIDQVEGRDTSPTIAYVHERLLNREAKLLSKVVVTLLPVTANVATHRNNTNNNNNNRGGHYNKSRSSNTGSQTSFSQHSNHRCDNRPFRPYLGKCQFCNVQGHSARRCPQLQNHPSVSDSQ
ncbi:PREDICTED: uncharacterized protein LOC104753802 [Camelina sativa]|uniref:Uncharacterized protein LOC104753802 n=1 Tax=Camelina sativa TaxID=90675 RepID=A0ABM0WPP8_CAMSA|nr:PREDICTED: uncharacterized protein LOC104753802 [Camelina sativa]